MKKISFSFIAVISAALFIAGCGKAPKNYAPLVPQDTFATITLNEERMANSPMVEFLIKEQNRYNESFITFLKEKAQDLVNLAIEKGTPILRDMAEEVRLKTIDVTKEVLKKLDSSSLKEIVVPGNRPYREGMNVPFSPISLPHCIECGFCTYECPANAIKKFNGLNTNVDACILCMACVSKCPRNARALPTHLQDSMNQKLLELKNSYLENQFFL